MMREMLRILVVCHVFFSIGCCQATAGEANEPTSDLLIQTRSTDGSDGCRSFHRLSNSMTMKGEIVRKVGDGYTAEECRQSCLSSSGFFCAAAQIQHPSTCFVTGYRLRNDYYSNHYTRTCDHGPSCFQKIEGMSAGIKESIQIPRHISADVYPIYCMAGCEVIGDSCVGFDLRVDGNKPRCVITDIGVIADDSASFDLYLRRC